MSGTVSEPSHSHMAKKRNHDEEDEESLITTQRLAKKRRVTDSDSEEETDKLMNTESNQSTSHKCTDIVGEEKIDVDKGGTHVSVDGNMVLLKTPPKRATGI